MKKPTQNCLNQRAYTARQQAAGLVLVRVWVPKAQVPAVKAFAVEVAR